MPRATDRGVYDRVGEVQLTSAAGVAFIPGCVCGGSATDEWAVVPALVSGGGDGRERAARTGGQLGQQPLRFGRSHHGESLDA